MGLRGCVKSLRLVPRSEQDRARLQRTRKVPVSLVQLADSIRTSFWPRYLGSGHKRLCMAKMVPQALGALHRNSADSVRHALATGITMRATNIISIAMTLLISTSAFADGACEKKAKTRNDFLACSHIDTNKMLADSRKIYQNIRKLAAGKKQTALDENFRIWNEKLKSYCLIVAYSFNEWGNDYAPDTDFQISACQEKIAAQELEFYKWLACPGDMETSDIPKCEAIKNVLGASSQ